MKPNCLPSLWKTAWLSVCLSVPAAAATVAKVDFQRDIRQLLSDNCYACHGPDAKKVKGGLRLDLREVAVQPVKSGKVALVPGKPEASELVTRIFSTDPEEQMPPPESNKTLTAAQKELLKRWIAEGAEYKGHWAYTPPTRPAAPSGSRAVDYLVRQHLDGLGLKPSPEADRRTLARRLSFDLIGLPPQPEQVRAFERDTSPEAYSELVEKLLASPHYGERMAIGWLDVVRFADTIGYHSDTPRDVWPYRDYVIRAFNQNKPFDQFTREQLAGDLLPNPTLEQRVGSAFNRLLLTTEEGGAQEKDYEARYLTDRVRAVGSVWLGQTIGCAQCHDHKFDPIKSRDFYSLGAFFADIKEPIIGARGPGAFVPTEEQAPILKRHAEEVAVVQREFDAPHPELSEEFERWKVDQLAAMGAEESWNRLKPKHAEAASGTELKIKDTALLATGKNPDTDSYILRFTNVVGTIAGLRLEVLPEDSLPAKGPGRASKGNFVLTEVLSRVEREGSDSKPLSFQSARATFEQTTEAENNPYGRWSAAAVIDGDTKGESWGWGILPEIGKPNQLQLELADRVDFTAQDVLVVELRQKHGSGLNLGHFRIGATTNAEALRAPMLAAPPKEIAEILKAAADKRTAEQKDKLFAHYKTLAPSLASLRKRLAEVKKARADFEATVARCLMTERAEKIRTVRILPRGNWMLETGDIVEPALPAYLAPNSATPSERRLNRLDLANWLVAPDNPLTARVVMNRLWKQFFGVGLSKVLDDLGSQGESPRNPELLDWLACEFRDSGWDLKHMVRIMVGSQTYRQTSVASRELLARDPDNRELARQSRWRLDAELVRDNALSIAGLLAPEIGGPSVRPYQPDGYWENLNFPVRNYEPSSGDGLYRRGLYIWWQRSYVHPSMLAFDAPTREECAVDRNRSNIPQQALVLLNDPSYVEAARGFAVRILRSGGADDTARLNWAWQQALGRSPRAEEMAPVRQLLTKHLAEFRQNVGAAQAYLKVGAMPAPADFDPAELAAWTNLARTLLNLHETITRS